MPTESLPPVVVSFINKYIDSIEQLEVLLLLQQVPENLWTVAQLDDQIRSDPASISQRLSSLIQHGLVTYDQVSNTFTSAPLSPEVRNAISALTNCYRERRTRVVEHIYSKPMRGAHSFAQAFVIGRKEEK